MSSPQAPPERRVSDRVPDDIAGLMTRSLHDGEIHAVRIRDLGDGGACAAADFEPEVGTEFFAGFFLRGFGGIPLIARVRVAWTRREDGPFERAIGLAFLGEGIAQAESVVRIRDYLAARRRELAGAVTCEEGRATSPPPATPGLVTTHPGATGR